MSINGAVAKVRLFADLGYGGAHDLLEAVLEEVGLSRPGKSNIAAAKVEAVARVLAERFVAVCSRGDCQAGIGTLARGRFPVAASSPGDCEVCGGSANARAVDDMVAAMGAVGLGKLCVVGGSPNSRTELETLVARRLDLRLIDGAVSRTVQQAQADTAWADRVAIWGGTILAHRLSNLYKGPNVIQFAKRSIQELAREVARSVHAG
jgi:hypothetical protein